MGFASTDCPLFFPFIASTGECDYGKVLTDKQFIKELRLQLSNAGMDPCDVQRVSAHSLRAGGCTDYSLANHSIAFIMQQGGWLSAAWLIYVRPAREHTLATARTIIESTHRLLDADM